MGLDMYLYADRMFTKWTNPHTEGDRKELEQALAVLEAANATTFPAPSLQFVHVAVEVAYWRKANAIHAWFVRNVQDGKDNCQQSYVPQEKLDELLDACKQVLANPEQASEILPTQSWEYGEYDDYYFSDLTHTIAQIEAVLDKCVGCEFYYEAS